MTYSHNHDDLARCQELLGQLNAYMDGELAAELCHDLEQHLADCPDCRVVFDTLTKTITLYRQLDDVPVDLPSDVEERLMHQLKRNAGLLAELVAGRRVLAQQCEIDFGLVLGEAKGRFVNNRLSVVIKSFHKNAPG
jgi:predicted anti-sigma-YlaC factor YlaD